MIARDHCGVSLISSSCALTFRFARLAVVPTGLLPNRRKTLRSGRNILRFRTGGNQGRPNRQIKSPHNSLVNRCLQRLG